MLQIQPESGLEAEPRLDLHGSAAQGAIRNAEIRVHGFDGSVRIHGAKEVVDSTSATALLRSTVDVGFVEQIVGIHAEREAGASTEQFRLRQAKHLCQAQVCGAVVRARQRVALNSGLGRGAKCRKGRRNR